MINDEGMKPLFHPLVMRSEPPSYNVTATLTAEVAVRTM